MSERVPSDARVFAVASGKGGVGKTTTAVNVGATLAGAGVETVVVDADLGMANVADLLDLSISGPTLQAVLAGELAVEKAIYRTHAGMAVVPGATDLASYGEVETERLREVVADLRAEFEYVLLDVGAGLSYDTALPLGLADAVVLVTTPWEAAARDTGKTRELADRIDAPVAGVAVTRVREGPAELGPEAVAETVGAPVLTAVPEDDAVQTSLAAGRPTVVHEPDGRVATAYRKLVAALTGDEVDPIADATASADSDDSTSLEELLEREAERSEDVSLLTGGAGVADSGDDPTPTLDLDEDDSSAEADAEDAPEDPLAASELDDDPPEADEVRPDDQPTADADDGAIVLGDESMDEPDEDPLADETPEPDDTPGDEQSTGDADGAIVLGDEPTDEPDGEADTDDPTADLDVEADGDILIADETPLDEIEDEGADAASNEERTPDPKDPLADIPRFEGESAGSSADASIDGPAEDAVEETADEATEEFTRGGDASAASEPHPIDAAAAGASADSIDESGAGPHVEFDDRDDDDDDSSLLGRLSGLFK